MLHRFLLTILPAPALAAQVERLRSALHARLSFLLATRLLKHQTQIPPVVLHVYFPQVDPISENRAFAHVKKPARQIH